jgi:hypothetical protein
MTSTSHPRGGSRAAGVAALGMLLSLFPILSLPLGTSAEPGGACTVRGLARLQGRATHGGIGLQVDGAAAASSDALGAFLLPPLESGSRRVTAMFPGYLPVVADLDCPSGGRVSLPAADLLGGDPTGDGKVDLFDLVRVGRAYGICQGQVGYDEAADLGANGCVDLFDLVLVGSNYGKTGPQAWPRDLSLFQTEVLPLMLTRCVSCHGNRGGISLSAHAAIMSGGVSGPAVLPGDPDRSLLIRKVKGEAGLLMPPGGDPLPPEDIALLDLWIREGARP